MLEIFLLFIILVCLIYISIVDNIFFSILINGIISFVFILFYLILKAPDIALTEMSIGSSISTVLFSMALLLIKNQKINKNYIKNINNIEKKIIYLFISILIYYFLNQVMGELPYDKNDNLGSLYIKNANQIFNIPSIVTSIIVGFRAFDTLYETLLIVVASLVFLKILNNKEF